jgi:hypothetical protein
MGQRIGDDAHSLSLKLGRIGYGIRIVMAVVMIATFVSLFVSRTSYAHIMLEDLSTGMKTLFHVAPDHSPVAGEMSTISYDFSKSGYKSKDLFYSLSIKKSRAREVSIPVTITSNVILVDYVFPTQGLYTLTLTVTPKDSTHHSSSVFVYNQRVSKGEVANVEGFGDFEVGILAIVVGSIGIVFVVMFKDRVLKRRGSMHEKSKTT